VIAARGCLYTGVVGRAGFGSVLDRWIEGPVGLVWGTVAVERVAGRPGFVSVDKVGSKGLSVSFGDGRCRVVV